MGRSRTISLRRKTAISFAVFARRPEGTVVIDVMMEHEGVSEWPSFLTLFMRAVSGGAAHSPADYRLWLETAGFHNVKQLSERSMAARK